MITTASMCDFLARYREFTEGTSTRRLEGVRGFLESAHDSVSALLEEIRCEDAREAPRFNIFRALDIERKEAVLHTRLLRHLLDPTAAHAQGNLFLRCFFDMMAGAHPARFTKPPEPLEDGRWVVCKELAIGDEGRLDLLIENSLQKYAVVVENKVDASEGDAQLDRYADWVNERRRGYEASLVFLTPSGRAPISALRSSDRWIRLSYRRHIATFLGDALKQLEAAQPVREVVRQYLLVVKSLSEVDDDES